MSERKLPNYKMDLNAVFAQVAEEDALRSKLDGDGGDDDGDGPIKGRVTNIRFLVPDEANAPKDGESEHEASASTPLFKTKLQIQTAEAKHGILAGSTTVGDRDLLMRKEVTVFGGTWKSDDYYQRVLSDTAIMVMEPKKPAHVIFTRAKLTPAQIGKVIKHFGADKVIGILAGEDAYTRIKEVRGIKPATAEKFIKAVQDNAEIPLEIWRS